jgi:hypothetical protein
MNREKLIGEFGELIDEIGSEDDRLMNEFFNILFWKDYSSGYLNEEDKQDIISEIKKCSKEYDYGEDGKGVNLDTEKILPFINRLRVKIGLPELTLELNHCLMELTDEVKKALVIKNLK